MYNTLMRPSTAVHSRRKLSVQLVSQQLKDDVPPPAPAPEAVLIEDTQQVVGVLDRSAGERESAFKARLQCAPAATPIVSAALGEYAAAFDLPSLVISDAKQGLAVESAADDSAIASPRL